MATERDTLAELIAREGADFHAAVDAPTTYYEAADAIRCAGYVRVVEDDETVEKMALALHADDNAWLEERQAPGFAWDELNEGGRDNYRRGARAALRALRGEERQ